MHPMKGAGGSDVAAYVPHAESPGWCEGAAEGGEFRFRAAWLKERW